MRKFFLFSLTLILLFSFLSCEEAVQQPPVTTGTLTLTPATSKELVWSANTTISEYVYKAVPLFEGNATGKALEWQHLSYGGAGTIGELTQGKWRFSLEGRNNKGTTITSGEVETYIQPGQENVVAIDMKTDLSTGSGSVTCSVWSQDVSSDGVVFKVYLKTTTTDGKTEWAEKWTNEVNNTDNPRFATTITNVPAGYNEILFMLFDKKTNAVLAGEQLGVQVVANEATSISGILEPSEEVTLDLSIKAMGYIHAILSPESGIEIKGEGRDTTAYIERGDTVTFSWQDLPDATSHPTEWIWAVDGTVISNTSSSYSVKYDEYGEHELSVIGLRRDDNGTIWDVGSAVIRIVVVKHLCDITFDANGGYFSDGQDLTVIQQDTTLESDRKIPGGIPYDGLSPQKTGYRLVGWKDKTTDERVINILSDGSVEFLDGFVTKEPTRTLLAIWEPGTFKATVIWNENVTVNGKNVPVTETFTIKSADKLSFLAPAPQRLGFTFMSYSTEENARGDIVTPSSTYVWGKDITIYANWEYVPITVQYYKVYSDYEAGLPPYKTTTVGSDLRYGSLPQPLRQGKVFKGWAQVEDVDTTKVATDGEGKSYLTQDALKKGKSYVSVSDRVYKFEAHPLLAVWGDGDIKISFNYGDGELTQKGKDNLAEYSVDDNGTYYKYGALGTLYGALPFTDIEQEVREGQEFMGWYDSPTFNMRVYEVSAVTNNQDHTLYAKWEGMQIVVSFETGTEEKLDTKKVRTGSLYGVLPIITRKGYTFAGWTYNGKAITEDSVVEAKKNHTLTATWTPLVTDLSLELSGGSYNYPLTMSLKYDATYGSAYSGAVVFKENSTKSGLKEPTRYGYDFAGWFNNPTGVGNAIKATDVNKIDIAQTLYAVWKAHRHTITFYNNWPKTKETEGKDTTSKKTDVAFGSSYGDLPALSVTGYTFNGWFTSDGKGVSATTKYSVDEDISLYAKWSLLKINVSFSDGGLVCKDQEDNTLTSVQREWGTVYGTLPTPYKKGYAFTGKWQVVGRLDASGNPIYVDSNTVITDTTDVTLSPIWQPEHVLVLVPYNVTVGTDGYITSADWSSYKTFDITFGSNFNSMRKATISNGTWTVGESETLPKFSRSGYWQDGWLYIVNEVKAVATDSTALIDDYNTLDSSARAKFGALTPERVVYLAPNWKENEYVIKFESLLETNGKIESASGAPYIANKTGKYNQSFAEAIGSDTSTVDWIQSWDGYSAEGIYLDKELTKEVKLTSVFGGDITVPAESGTITLYVKWRSVRTMFSVDTKDLTQYPENGKFSLYNVYEAFSGGGAGFISGQTGWYKFSGNVDEDNYTTVRIGNGSDITLLHVHNEGDKTISLPGQMNVKVYATASVYNRTERCTVCNGNGQTGFNTPNTEYSGSLNAPTNTYNLGSYDKMSKTYKITYSASRMYDFCPNGCKNWSNHNKGYWVTCPNCNGNPESVHDYGWRIYHFHCDNCNGNGKVTTTCSSCGGDGGDWVKCSSCDGSGKTSEYCSSCSGTGTVYTPNDCSQCRGTGKISGGNVECPKCSGTGSLGEIALNCPKCNGTGTKSETCSSCGGDGDDYETCSSCGGNGSIVKTCSSCNGVGEYDEAYYIDKQCYCVWLAQTKGWKAGQIWLSGHRDIGTHDGGCTVEIGTTRKNGNFNETFQGYKGTRVRAILTPYTTSNSNIIVELKTAGNVIVTDNASEFTSVALAGGNQGKVLNLNYDNYKIEKGAYFYTNGNAVKNAGTTYYAYNRIPKLNYYVISSSGDKSLVKTEEATSTGFYTESNMDTSMPRYFEAVTQDGTVYSGTPNVITWTKDFIEVTYNGSSAFRWSTRNDTETKGTPVCKSYTLSFFLKDN